MVEETQSQNSAVLETKGKKSNWKTFFKYKIRGHARNRFQLTSNKQDSSFSQEGAPTRGRFLALWPPIKEEEQISDIAVETDELGVKLGYVHTFRLKTIICILSKPSTVGVHIGCMTIEDHFIHAAHDQLSVCINSHFLKFETYWLLGKFELDSGWQFMHEVLWDWKLPL